MKKLFIGTVFAGLMATSAQATEAKVVVDPSVTAPTVYENVQIRPVVRPFSPSNYRDGSARHDEYDYSYWYPKNSNDDRRGWEK